MKLQHIIVALLSVAPALASAQVAAPQPTTELVARIKTNVAQITEPTERDRWNANLELWQLKLRIEGAPTTADLDRMKVLIDRIATNLGRISAPAEKDRWQANLDMWTAVAVPSEKLPKEEVAKLRLAFERMKTNIAKITELKEKDRWQANRDLWSVQLAKFEMVGELR